METGNLGEDLLVHWCNQVGWVHNKAAIDKDGWDFLISLPSTYDQDLVSLDKDEKHDRLLIQVKTTEIDRGNRSIKVSNLKKLVNSPIPAFYLLIQVSKRGRPINAYLFHVWEEIIFRVQEKLRKTPRDKWKSLHKTKMSLPWVEAQEMREFHGDELLRIIEKNLRPSKNDYSKRKKELIESVGYEENKGSVNFNGIVPDEYKGDIDKLLIDFFLGEIESLDVTEYEVTDKRFDEEVVVTKNKGGKLKLKNIEPEGNSILKFTTKDFRASSKISAEMFVPKGVDRFIDHEKLKILFKAPFIKIFIYPIAEKCEIKTPPINFGKDFILSEIIDLADFTLFLNETEKSELIDFEITKDHKPFMKGSFDLRNNSEKESLPYFKALVYANGIIKYLKIDNNLTVNPNSLKQQFSRLEFLDKILSPKPLTINLKTVLSENIDKYEKTVCLYPITIKISNKILAFQVVAEGRSKNIGQSESGEYSYELTTQHVYLEQYRVLDSEEKLISAHKEMDDNAIEKYDVHDEVMVLHGVK